MDSVTFNAVTYDGLSFTNIALTEIDTGFVESLATSGIVPQGINNGSQPGIAWAGFSAGAFYANASEVLNFSYSVSSNSAASLIDSANQLYIADQVTGAGVSLTATENIYSTTGSLLGTEEIVDTPAAGGQVLTQTYINGVLEPLGSPLTLSQAVPTINVQVTVAMVTGADPSSAVSVSEFEQTYGSIATSQTASIGDIAFLDVNGTGVESGFNSGPGVSGVVVELLNSTGTSVLATTTTNSNGLYNFTGLTPGVYEVEFVAPTGYTFSPELAANTPSVNSSADQTTGITGPITLVAGETDNDVEVGLVPGGSAGGSSATIGTTVWLDSNDNGLDDNGEQGVAGVTVDLLSGTGSLIATTTTNSSGNYQFTDLAPGTYQVTFQAPTGDTFTTENVSPGNTGDLNSVANSAGQTALITLTAGEIDDNVNAGLLPPAALGSTVWLDTNDNGLDDNGEVGVAGVTVDLLSGTGSVIATTTTNSNGIYAFTGLAPGAYEVQFIAPAGDAFTIENAPLTGGATINSSADSSGLTAAVTLTPGETDNNVNAGLIVLSPTVSIVKSVTSVGGVAGDPAATAAGQVIDYSVVVTNTGNETLTNVVVTDATLGTTLATLASLAPGATDTYTASQTVTQAEIDNGGPVTNTATVSDTQTPSESSTVSTAVTDTPAVSIVKSVTSVGGVAGDPAATVAGQVIDYSVVVANTGNETLTNVAVTDTTLGTTLATLSSLAPGASDTYTASQTVTQAEIDSGNAVANTATVTDTQTPSESSTVSTAVTDTPAVSILKTVTSVGGVAGDPAATTAGQVIDYSIVVSNTGNETLTNVVVADATLGTTLATLPTLAAGASDTYTASQTVTQAEINSGGPVTNTATVTDTQTPSGSSSVSTAVTDSPAVSILKTVTSVGGVAGDPAATTAGQVIDYNVVVTNTGNETLTNVLVTDATLGTTLATLASLAPGATDTYTASQTVTQTEIDSGNAVTNTATVSDTQTPTQSSTASTAVTDTPAVSIVKSATSVGGVSGDPAATAAGQTIDYNIVVANTGNETLTNVVVTDTTLGTILATLSSLAPGTTDTYTASQPVTQAEINSGGPVTNTATVSDTQTPTGSSTASTAVTDTPAVSIVKSVTSVGGVSGDPAATTAGQVIDYNVVVTNTGNETLTNVVVTDTTLGTTLATLSSLAPGATDTYTASQTVTQAEINSGGPVTNTATVADTQTPTGSSTASTAVTDTPAVSIVKSVTSVGGVSGDPAATTAGQVIDYNVVVTNTGNETLTNVVVTDTTLGTTLATLSSLAPGATDTYTASQTVTQAEINSGGPVTNTATVSDTQTPTGSSTVSTAVTDTPAVSIVKSVTSVGGVSGDPAATTAGQVIDYNVVVTNTGNETLTNVVVKDTTLGTTLATLSSLAPGATDTYTASQTVTQAEISGGNAVTNTATVSDTQTPTETSTASTLVTNTPAVSIVKSVTSVGGVSGDPAATAAGQVIDYNIVVANTGNETLTNVVVKDTTLGTTLATLSSLAPGATDTYTASQTVTQAEINSGGPVTNTATVSDTQTPTGSSTVSTAVTDTPAVSIVKSVTSVGGVAGDPAATTAGQVIDYNIVVTNTGNETLTNVVVTDTTLGTTLATLTSLAPGAADTYTASQTVTQAEINSGGPVTNTATVADTQTPTGSSTVSTAVTDTPAVSIVKSVTSVGGVSGDPAATTAGQVIDYNVVVTNTGNETLTNVVVTDTTLGTTLATLSSLAPGATDTYTASQTVTQAEINSGAPVTNTATVADTQTPTQSSTASTAVTDTPAVSIVKSVTSVGGVSGDPAATTAGQVIDYNIVVTNTGNETLTNVVVKDTTLGTTLATLSSLAPGATDTYTASQTVTQAEISSGNAVTNTATVSDTQTPSESSTASTAVSQAPAVSIVKTVTSVGGVSGDPAATKAGQLIDYSIVVTNTGNETLTNVVVKDTTLGTTLATLSSLAPGASDTYTASQTVTQAELDSCGPVTNTATVSDTQTPTGSSTASTAVTDTPAVSIVKSVTSVGGVAGDPAVTKVGEVIDYSIVVANTGNETLTNVVVKDTTLGTTLATLSSLAPGATDTYTASQTVTQAELDSCSPVTNTATVSDTQTPTGSSTASTALTDTPAVSIVKTVTSVGGVAGDPTATKVGQVIDYSIVVTNTGNETLTNVVVKDTTLGTTLATLSSLAPGAADTYTAAQTVTQADLDSCSPITNTATVSDTQTPTGSSTASTSTMVAPSVSIVKTVTSVGGVAGDPTATAAGQVIDYSIVVTNTGSETLTNVLVKDTTLGTTLASLNSLAPGASDTYTASQTVTQAELSCGSAVTNTATVSDTQTPTASSTASTTVTEPAALGSIVWFDTNRDGLDDNGDVGVAGVTVDLLNGTGTTVLATTTTNSSGIYAFANLTPGVYEVKFVAPSGDIFSTEGVPITGGAITNSSANQTTGITAPVTLTAGETDNNVNAGLQTPPASIGDIVWFDSNKNGLLDNGELGVAGVTVELLNSTGASVLATTTTNSTGGYEFTNLNAGTYEVKFITPSGDSFTTEGVGSNAAINSSANQTTGITAPITLTAGQVDNNVEAGLVSTNTASGISVLKQPSTVVVNQCGQVTYTFTVTNTGATSLTNLKIQDNIGSAANPDYITPTLVTTGFNGTLAAGSSLTYTETVNQITCSPGNAGSVCHTTSGSNLSSGCTAWLSSSFNPTSCANGATYKFQGITCDISGGGLGSRSIAVDCPDSVVTFSSSCTTASTVYNASTNCWVTTLPANGSPGSVFLSGIPVTIPNGCSLVNSSVTWSIGDSSNNCGATSLVWDGTCTGYSSFNQNGLNGTTNYNDIGVKSCDNNSGYGAGGSCYQGYGYNGSSYCNSYGWSGSSSDCAGTPENQYTNGNCGNNSNCNNGYGGNGYGGNGGSCGGSGTATQNLGNILGAADTVTVSATTPTSTTVTASDTKEVQILGNNSDVTVNGTAPTGSLSATYGTAQTLEFAYTPGNTVSLKQLQTGLGTVTGTNSNTMAFMEITNNSNPFASGASIYFEGAVTSGEHIFADATTNVLTNTPIVGGHFSTTSGADIFAYVFASQAAFKADSAPVQTIAYNTSGSQAMHIGDTIGSLSVIGYVGANGGHLVS